VYNREDKFVKKQRISTAATATQKQSISLCEESF
jgi:hypothetical protein